MNKTINLKEQILELSLEKFRRKTFGQIDRVADLFDDGLEFTHLTGRMTSKSEWILQLRAKTFIYNKVKPQEHRVEVYGDMPVSVGKAWFTVNDGRIYKLIYTEVYTIKMGEWKLVPLYTRSYIKNERKWKEGN
ncbi:hypothetical protein DHW03_08025 [Pedobacter yonginense]|uniref:DUF4440 domain-containing protein n=1 Tax=Pedobacter yonginense TaxID=651869 RepID=A0A317EMB1_9SPHI|nr:nuclear transport factor 2 family protein [Pedobacter yonginense]PWS27535.1 hypothetical protein DHW03_08025 [Pedobacter yonginense]